MADGIFVPGTLLLLVQFGRFSHLSSCFYIQKCTETNFVTFVHFWITEKRKKNPENVSKVCKTTISDRQSILTITSFLHPFSVQISLTNAK